MVSQQSLLLPAMNDFKQLLTIHSLYGCFAPEVTFLSPSASKIALGDFTYQYMRHFRQRDTNTETNMQD